MSNLKKLLLLAILASVICVVAWLLAARQFFLAYLAAVMLPWSVSVGSLGLLLIYSLTGGRWGRAALPWLMINARLMPLVALLFLPMLFGIHEIYSWANSDTLRQFDNTENRQWFYQTPFFVGRTVFYFILWTVLAILATGRSRDVHADESNRACPVIGGQAVAGLGAVALLLSITWAGMDWVMSFDPFVGSTLFGALLGMGAMLSGIAASVAAVCFLPLYPPSGGSDAGADVVPAGEGCVSPSPALRGRLSQGESDPIFGSTDDKAIGDLSGLLLAFLMLWAYFSFAHFLIMWMGNLPTESRFYAVRTVGIWGWIAPLLALGGFAIPFLCLLSYRFKRTPRLVGTLAIALLAVRWVELWWMVLPADGHSAAGVLPWAIIPATVAVVSLYAAGLAWSVGRWTAKQLGGLTHDV